MPTIDVELFQRMIKGIKAVEVPVRRMNQINSRVYEISRLLPAKEGFELIKLHEENQKLAVQSVIAYKAAVSEEGTE